VIEDRVRDRDATSLRPSSAWAKNPTRSCSRLTSRSSRGRSATWRPRCSTKDGRRHVEPSRRAKRSVRRRRSPWRRWSDGRPERARP